MFCFIFSDFIKLGKDFNINVSGALNQSIDLGTYANNVLNYEPDFRWSMAKLVQQLVS